jgi:excisionase family DNA binding protein
MAHTLEHDEPYRQLTGRVSGTQPFLTPPEVAKQLRVTPQKVITWIRRGELGAVNVSDRVRPRYRVNRVSLNKFLERRKVRPPSPAEDSARWIHVSVSGLLIPRNAHWLRAGRPGVTEAGGCDVASRKDSRIPV